jgi:Fic family protein
MNRNIGTYVIQTLSVEPYKAYIPKPLPPIPPVNMIRLYPYLEKATKAISELNSFRNLIPNTSLFLYMCVRKEALLSNQIEGTQSSFSDLILFENEQNPDISLEDVEEVSNYVKAINYALDHCRSEFPLSLRLLRETHGILLSGGRGSGKSPGEFRRSQNWIGGTKPSNALFVPPPVEHLNQCLYDFEAFLHDNTLPVLIKAGLAHVQFETIHPFLDGNGRLGRLLITLILYNDGLIDAPILYLSLFFKQNRTVYYNLLHEVRSHGIWEIWLEFFLEGVCDTAKQSLQFAFDINRLFNEDTQKIASLGRARFSCESIFAFLKKMPQVNSSMLAKNLDMTPPTVRDALNRMVQLGILEEKTGKKRDKVYVYRQYLKLLEYGAEPFKH